MTRRDDLIRRWRATSGRGRKVRGLVALLSPYRGRVALMFLIPGSNTTMRLNGRAVVRIDAETTGRFVMDGKHPRPVVVITIAEG